jgi:hypothetical protein
VTNSSILYNSAKHGGGGVFTNGGEFKPEDTKIRSNDAAYGGGCYVFNGEVDLGEDVTFIDNVARRKGPNMFNEAFDNTNIRGDLSAIGYGIHTQERKTILNKENLWTLTCDIVEVLGTSFGAYSAWLVMVAAAGGPVGWVIVIGFLLAALIAAVATTNFIIDIYKILFGGDSDMCPEPE